VSTSRPYCSSKPRRIPARPDAGLVAKGDNGVMDIQLNGEHVAVGDGITVVALLEQQGLGTRRVAVEINGEIVPRGQHAERRLQAGDRVEIVHALGGG